MSSVQFIGPQDTFLCFTLDGPTSKKRAIARKDPVKNFISLEGGTTSFIAEFPPLVGGGDSVQDVSVVRYLPYAEEVVILIFFFSFFLCDLLSHL
jgi:hypothetical protein